MNAPCRAVGRQCLGRGPEVELDARRNAEFPRSPIESHALPSGGWPRSSGDDVIVAQFGEIAVIADVAHRAAERRVNRAVGCPSHSNRGLDSFGEEIAYGEQLAGARVEPRKLGVRPKPAARGVDLLELVFEERSRLRDRSRLGHQHGRRRPQGGPRRGDDHRQEPPDETTGALGAGAGGVEGGLSVGSPLALALELELGWVDDDDAG